MSLQDLSFKQRIETTDSFIVTCEHIPGRLSRGKKLDEIIEFATKGKETGLVHALSLTDNPGGTPALNPDFLAAEIEQAGLPVIVHMTTKDMNRNMIESRLLSLDRMGIKNVLVMSGDYQTLGQAGLPMPVFDIDPVHTLTMITMMNRGWRTDCFKRELEECTPTEFYPGAVASPYKFTEPGMMLQLYKMEKKARAGARYFVTQLGFDAGKLKDFMRYRAEIGIDIPVIGSVFILRKGAAAAMHRGDIPGSYVSETLLAEVQKESTAPDKGRAASLERAAMQVAVLMGLGFRGAHIEAMVLKFGMVETILGRAAELKDSWEECAEKLAYAPDGAFYLGGKGHRAASPATRKLKRGWLTYRTMRALHALLFTKGAGLGRFMHGVSSLLDRVPLFGKTSHILERVAKEVLFDCRDCGDCALPELQYLCPQSQCPKQQRNGPCGGSRLDACEVYPERPCVWNRAYVRAKAFGELDDLRRQIIGPRDWQLYNTSSWVNYHLDRDHAAYDFTGFFSAPEKRPNDAAEPSSAGKQES